MPHSKPIHLGNILVPLELTVCTMHLMPQVFRQTS